MKKSDIDEVTNPSIIDLYYDFLFAAAETSKPVEVLRVGTFTDRSGREVTITLADIDEMVSNFEAGEAGQDVPIDIDHERQAAAGWIKRLFRQGEKLLAETDWNKLGKDLVGDKVYRYLSATIDMGRKVIKSISLVNFPAVKGLKPVELSEGVYHLADRVKADEPVNNKLSEGNTMNEINEMDREKLRAEIRAELETELAQQQQTVAELREQVQAEVEAELKAKFERRETLAQFAEEICNGEAGLSTPPDQIVEFLEALPAEEVERAQAILRAKVVSFSETGSSQNGKPKLAQLPEYAAKDVQAGRLTVNELFEAKAVAGTLGDYDLSEFSAEQIG